jgi:hypothetical protein
MKTKFILCLIVAGVLTTSFLFVEPAKPVGVGDEIRLTPCEESKAFPNAAIAMYKSHIISDSVSFSFDLKDYVLGTQTTDAYSKVCANSAKGQHIHLILNNQPYEAWYISSFGKKLPEGHYVALSFLSRSYHESIKHRSAYVLEQFNVGKDYGNKKGDINLKKPLLFYSRPKGEYVGTDTKRVLLDFYLANVKLSPGGYKVRATINGKEFMITEWKPFYIDGLPMGESTVKLELLDKKNKPASKEAMFQTIERKIVLKEN